MTIVPDVPPLNICIARHTRIYHTPNDHHNANNQMSISSDTRFYQERKKDKPGLKDASDAFQPPLSSLHLTARARLYGSQGHLQGKK